VIPEESFTALYGSASLWCIAILTNLSLTLQVEAMLNLEKENRELNEMLEFKSKTNLKILPVQFFSKHFQLI